MPPRDDQFNRIARAFEKSLQRMCAAPTEEDLEDELSNLLHHLYRLDQWCKKRFADDKKYYSALAQHPRVRAAVWVRTFDTHDGLVAASTDDVYSDYFTNMHGVLVWQAIAETDHHGRHLDYRNELEGKPVLDTIRSAFDELASL